MIQYYIANQKCRFLVREQKTGVSSMNFLNNLKIFFRFHFKDTEHEELREQDGYIERHKAKIVF